MLYVGRLFYYIWKVMTSVFITRTYLIFTCSKIEMFWSLNLWENIWKLLIGLRKFIVSQISSLFRDWNQTMRRDIVLSNNCRLSLLVCSMNFTKLRYAMNDVVIKCGALLLAESKLFQQRSLYMLIKNLGQY